MPAHGQRHRRAGRLHADQRRRAARRSRPDDEGRARDGDRRKALTTSTVFLVNPASANGSTGKHWPEIAHRASLGGLDGDALISSRPGEIVELAERAARDGADLIVVVGGDGTINEAVNGLLRSDRVPELAVIAHGTGDDFIRTHKIPAAVDRAVEVARGGTTRLVDLGRVEFHAWDGSRGERYFANVGSIGMSGAVAQRANATSKALGGRVSFFTALVRVFFAWKNTEVTVELEGTKRQGRMHDVIVAIGQYHGGAMWLTPDAQPDDGLFDVLLIGDVTKADFVRTVPKIYRGTHLSHPKTEVLRSPFVSVEAPVPLPLETDGELLGTTPARFEIVPHALRVRVP